MMFRCVLYMSDIATVHLYYVADNTRAEWAVVYICMLAQILNFPSLPVFFKSM